LVLNLRGRREKALKTLSIRRKEEKREVSRISSVMGGRKIRRLTVLLPNLKRGNGSLLIWEKKREREDTFLQRS